MSEVRSILVKWNRNKVAGVDRIVIEMWSNLI